MNMMVNEMSPAASSGHPRLRFDRGTLLLETGTGVARGSEAHIGREVGISGMTWDARVERHRAPASSRLELVEALASRGELRNEVMSPESSSPVAGWTPPELRPYQESALLAWELARRRGVVVLPTGGGKTRVALAAMARTGRRALCLVPTRALLDQWCAEISKAYAGPLGRFGDGAREAGPVTVATFESAYRHMSALGNRFELLIVDEAHHAGAELREEALEMCASAARLGLTATPPRDGFSKSVLERLVGPTVFELAIGDLQGSFLADFELIVMELALTPDERTAYERDMRCFREVLGRYREVAPASDWAAFARTAGRTPEGREALSAFRRARRLLGFPQAKAAALGVLLRRHRASKLLVFTADNETAYAIARRHLVMPLTCDVPRREREEALARFRSGELRSLVSARVLNEGIDVPDADVAIVVAGTLGEREHVQRVGRLLRPMEGKRALVYELVARGTSEVRQSRRRRAGLAARAPDSL